MTIYENGMSDLSPTDQEKKVRPRRAAAAVVGVGGAGLEIEIP